MSITKKPLKSVNTNAKSLLAKCMATENIRVTHDSSAETAAFDVKNRELVLPVWKDMSNSMYDMLVAHEVSHALHTPFDEWMQALKGIKNVNAFKQVCNVVEDARIERLIKESFPGVRKDFARAYGQLHDQDLFELNGVNISEMGLIDRLNIHFKLGLFGLVQVPFSAEEKSYVARMDTTETFSEVVELATELFNEWDSQQDDDDSSQSQSQDGESQDSNEDGSNAVSTASQDSDTSESTDGAGSDAEVMSQPNLDDIQGDMQDQNQSQDGESQDGESQDGEGQEGESQDGEGQEGEDHGADFNAMSYDDYSSDASNSAPSQTQSAFDKGMRDMVSTETGSYDYHDLPASMNLDNCIMDFKEVAARWDKFNRIDRASSPQFAVQTEEWRNDCTTFIGKSKSIVNHMVSQFQMKQNANQDARTMISKSGVLDTTSMVNYRWSEDIFMTNTEVRDGKNHGMIFFLDWSGSMCNIMKDTVEQLLILTEFCNKINIPFEVYAFSSKSLLAKDDNNEYIEDFQQSIAADNAKYPLNAHGFTLINFVSSRMNKMEYRTAISNLYVLANNDYYGPEDFRTVCTPLNEAIVCAMDIVPAFQEATGVEIVNTVFLTDGQGQQMCPRAIYHKNKTIIHDPVSKNEIEVSKTQPTHMAETNAYLELLKARCDCNIIGIYLHPAASVANLRYSFLNEDDIQTAVTMFKKENYCIASASSTSYDELFIVKGNMNATEDIFAKFNDGQSHAQMRNAFKKATGNHKQSRVIATKMIEIFAATA